MQTVYHYLQRVALIESMLNINTILQLYIFHVSRTYNQRKWLDSEMCIIQGGNSCHQLCTWVSGSIGSRNWSATDQTLVSFGSQMEFHPTETIICAVLCYGIYEIPKHTNNERSSRCPPEIWPNLRVLEFEVCSFVGNQSWAFQQLNNYFQQLFLE